MTQRRLHVYENPYFVTFNTRVGLRLFEDVQYAELLGRIMVNAGRLKRFDILAYQIMPDHVHVLVFKNNNTDRTLEKVRSTKGISDIHIPQRTLSRVRDVGKKQSPHTISDLMQSIKGNFSRKVHMGNIWQRRFYAKVIDTDEYLRTVVEYIEYNPIGAGLPAKYKRMPYQCIDHTKIGTCA